jgi:hypothetical protein
MLLLQHATFDLYVLDAAHTEAPLRLGRNLRFSLYLYLCFSPFLSS